jgi:hypothetical protein
VSAQVTAGGTPHVVLLTHPFLPPPPFPGARALRVHYPGEVPRRTSESDVPLSSSPSPEQLGEALGRLLVPEQGVLR